MTRLARAPIAIAVVAAVAIQLGATACAHPAQPPAWNPGDGSAGLLATSGGVVWSLAPSDLGDAVLRSGDNGRHWQIVLAARHRFLRYCGRILPRPGPGLGGRPAPAF